MRKPSTQASKLLPSLFEQVDREEPLTVFHAGPALSDTVEFFSNYRCKLHFIDVFAELPIEAVEDTTPTLQQQFENMMRLPSNTSFDICLFWDLFNFLSAEAISAFLTVLRGHLKKSSLAHAFSVHNRKTPQLNHLYGINQPDTLSFRSGRPALPGYAPHSQNQLKDLLFCFRVERSVLLPDSRLELLLQAKL